MKEKQELKEIVNGMVWSYSRLESFENCPYGWYLRYLEKEPSYMLFYTAYGKFMHELLAEYYGGKATPNELEIFFLTNFKKRVPFCGISTKTVLNTFDKGVRFLRSLKPLPIRVVSVEEKFDFKIGNLCFTGIIDLLCENNGEFYIIDHKSKNLKPRSNRAKPTLNDIEIDRMLKQLYLYSAAVKSKYGKFPTHLCFNCFNSQILINEIFDESKYSETIEWALRIIEKIKNTEIFSPVINYFFCKNICGQINCCYGKGSDAYK